MELLQKVLKEILEKESIEIRFTNLSLTAREIVEMHCYQALQEIKAILDDDHFDDPDCFLKIEEVICAFERMGIKGDRHDLS